MARSSFLGRDPWGDEELPEPAIPGTEADEESGAEATEAKHSKEQLLLMDIQDRMYAYLTTHLWRILAESIHVDVRAREMLYDKDEGGIRTQTARKRMPWKEYKRVVLDMLPKTSGLYELSLLLTLHRHDKESARKWAQRLALGKMAVEDVDVRIPDAIYVEILLNYMTVAEMDILAREDQSRKVSLGGEGASAAAKLKPAAAKLKLFESEWSPLLFLVETTLQNNYSYRKTKHGHLAASRVYTADQALAYAKQKRATASGQSRPKRSRPGKKPYTPGQECYKCKKAGLTGKLVLHDHEKCDPRRRARNVRRLLVQGVNKIAEKKPKAN